MWGKAIGLQIVRLPNRAPAVEKFNFQPVGIQHFVDPTAGTIWFKDPLKKSQSPPTRVAMKCENELRAYDLFGCIQKHQEAGNQYFSTLRWQQANRQLQLGCDIEE
jgi:hypothetical protein